MKVRVIRCKCGNPFAFCCEPECYTDKDWQKDVRHYVRAGCTVDTVEAGEVKVSKCPCKKD